MWFLYPGWKSGLECRKVSVNGKIAAFSPSLLPLSVAGEVVSDTRALPNFGESWMVGR